MPDPSDFAQFDEIEAGYDDITVFRGLGLSIPKGRVTALCGPNGCGKSTALKLLRRLLRPAGGRVLLDEEDIRHFPERALARRIAMLTQAPAAPGELTVRQLVALGRFSYIRILGGERPEDRAAVRAAIVACDLAELETRPLASLSGGQLQRAWIAMVLAQDAPAILLDEPTNHLDIVHQLDTLDLIQRLNREHDRTVVLVLHDLNLAARFADHVVMFRKGRVLAEGAPEAVMTEKTIGAVFGIDCRVMTDPVFGRPMCIPYRRPSGEEGLAAE